MAARTNAVQRKDAICFLSSGAPEADNALATLVERYGNCSPKKPT